ncbi:MAG: GspH/FimT family pseudopilin, partial [Deltaproteobacteria bacterium]
MKDWERGTTIFQVVITLAIISVLSGVVVHQMREWLPNYRLRSAVRSILIQIQKARMQAVQRCTVYYLDFDLDGDGSVEPVYCALWEDRNKNRHKEHQEESGTVVNLSSLPDIHLRAYPTDLGGPEHGPNKTSVEAGGGDGISFSRNRIKFNPDGTCSTGTIYLHNRKG